MDYIIEILNFKLFYFDFNNLVYGIYFKKIIREVVKVVCLGIFYIFIYYSKI